MDARAARPSSCCIPARGSTTASSRCSSVRGSRPGRRSSTPTCAARGRSDRSTPAERRVERWADDVRELCDARRDRAAGRARARLRLGRRAQVRRPPPAASGRARARSADRAGRAGAVDRGVRAARRRGRACGRGALLRRHGRAGIRRLPPRLLPAALELRAHERRDRPRRLEPGGADGVDARRGQGARPARRARRDPRAGARAGRRAGRVGAARVGAGGLRAARRAQALPQLSRTAATPSSATRPRPTRTCGSSSTTSRRWRRGREGRASTGSSSSSTSRARRSGRTGPGCATGRP